MSEEYPFNEVKGNKESKVKETLKGVFKGAGSFIKKGVENYKANNTPEKVKAREDRQYQSAQHQYRMAELRSKTQKLGGSSHSMLGGLGGFASSIATGSDKSLNSSFGKSAFPSITPKPYSQYSMFAKPEVKKVDKPKVKVIYRTRRPKQRRRYYYD